MKPPSLSLGTINQGSVSFTSGSNGSFQGTNTNASSPTQFGTPLVPPRSGSIQLGSSGSTLKPVIPKDAADVENRLSMAAQEVAEFLDDLNLSSYSESLIDEGYDDIRSLRTLTESDLVELGFRKGHRARLMQAVKELALTTPRDMSATPRDPSESVQSVATM
eukprot:TRINITY_DN871_c4_g1_i1.p1 TRINITY_DN871_c4_g1~~TRINITY_DN871_c4_g1_i1.p1  ORF type:complete len:163 (+),score=22.13 TRINITY_DN871_c4_g1_i1:138-626(+)